MTRAATEDDLGHDVFSQLSRHQQRRADGRRRHAVPGHRPRPAQAALPHRRRGRVRAGVTLAQGPSLPRPRNPSRHPQPLRPTPPRRWPPICGVEPLALELALDLIDLVQPERGGDLLDRVKALRRKIAIELGIVMPQVHTPRQPRPGRRHLRHQAPRRRGGPGRGAPRQVARHRRQHRQLPGADTRDPAFGGRAKWIAADLRHQAAVAGVTVVDRSSVITTHLAEVVRDHAGSLLSRQDTKVLARRGQDL